MLGSESEENCSDILVPVVVVVAADCFERTNINCYCCYYWVTRCCWMTLLLLMMMLTLWVSMMMMLITENEGLEVHYLAYH